MKIEGRRRDRSTSFLLSQQSVRRVPRYRPATKGRPPYRTTVPLHITHKDEDKTVKDSQLGLEKTIEVQMGENNQRNKLKHL